MKAIMNFHLMKKFNRLRTETYPMMMGKRPLNLNRWPVSIDKTEITR